MHSEIAAVCGRGGDRMAVALAPSRASTTLPAVRRSPTVRLIAVVLAILTSLTPPGAALAHGYAHHREYHGEHHGKHRDGADHPEHELRDDGSTGISV